MQGTNSVGTGLQPNNADARTIREYLVSLLSNLWFEKESFSDKRPFGNSCWKYELYTALVLNKAIQGQCVKYEGDDCIYQTDVSSFTVANRIISDAIKSLY